MDVLRADAAPAGAVIDAFNASFADYLVRFPTMDDDGWRTFVRRQGIDLSLSIVARKGDDVFAFAMITPRPSGRTRVAVMGARPEARGTGVAKRLLDDVIAEASARGDRWIELEAFAQNERAVRVYRGRDFEPVDELLGFIAAPGEGASSADAIHNVSRDEAAAFASTIDGDDPALLAWQTGGEAILTIPGRVTAWRCGGAQAVLQETETVIFVISLLDRDVQQRDAARLLSALRRKFPELELRAPQLHRARTAGRAFQAAGWTRQPLHQLLLRRSLRG